MHKLITGWPRTDHIDHDTLNNQKSNLRPVTDQQNHFNRRSVTATTSVHKGVSWDARRRIWIAGITASGQHFGLGSFVSETEAAIAYDKAAAEKHGAYACLNFPEGVTPALLKKIQAERSAAGAVRLCVTCRAPFEPARRDRKYCSDKCRIKGAGQLRQRRIEAEREGEQEGALF